MASRVVDRTLARTVPAPISMAAGPARSGPRVLLSTLGKRESEGALAEVGLV
jgi:hypothetical protein